MLVMLVLEAFWSESTKYSRGWPTSYISLEQSVCIPNRRVYIKVVREEHKQILCISHILESGKTEWIWANSKLHFSALQRRALIVKAPLKSPRSYHRKGQLAYRNFSLHSLPEQEKLLCLSSHGHMRTILLEEHIVMDSHLNVLLQSINKL